MEKLINQSELSRYITNGGDRNCIRFTKKISPKHIEKLDKLFLEDLPSWWREYRKEFIKPE